jgi:hypothetical protein
MKKADFAKIPQYLDTVKQKIAHEKAIVHEFNARMTQVHPLPLHSDATV